MVDPWQEKIAEFIGKYEKVTVAMVARDALFIETARIAMRDAYRIIDVLTSLGWVRFRTHGVSWYMPKLDA